MDIKRIIALAAAAAMLGASAVTVSAAAGEEFIYNGGMENIDSGTNATSNWFAGNAEATGAAVSPDATTKRTGDRSLSVTGAKGGKDGGSADQYFKAPTLGKTYKITAYINPETSGTYSIAPLNNYWETDNMVISGYCEAGKWTELSGNITIVDWNAGVFRIWPEKNAEPEEPAPSEAPETEEVTYNFYIDDVSMVEQPVTEVSAYTKLKDVLTDGGTANMTENIVNASEKVRISNSKAAFIYGNDHTFERNTGSGYDNMLIQLGDNGQNDVVGFGISDLTITGSGTLLGMNSTQSNVTLKNIGFNSSSEANSSTIYVRNGTLNLENVTFPDRETGYDLTSDWGCGTINLTGATKLTMQKKAQWYSIDVTGLTAGADVKIAFTGAEGDPSQIPYNALKAQESSLDPSLEMICDETTKTIHIKTKTHREGFSFVEEVSLSELNGKKLYLTRGDGGTATLETGTYTSGLGDAIVGIIINNIPSDVTITSVELR